MACTSLCRPPKASERDSGAPKRDLVGIQTITQPAKSVSGPARVNSSGLDRQKGTCYVTVLSPKFTL